MTTSAGQFVRNCIICQASKYDFATKPGLLQPLPVPQEVWIDISMDSLLAFVTPWEKKSFL